MMTVPFAKVPHSAVMITTARELRVYLFRCATAHPKSGLSRWPVERLAVRMGLTYDSVAKAEKALVKLGFLSRGEDTRGQYWQAKDPDPMNLWTVQRSEYIPSSDGNHAELCMGTPSEDSMETIRGQHGNRPMSARDKAGNAVSVGIAAGGEEKREEKREDTSKEPGPPPAREALAPSIESVGEISGSERAALIRERDHKGTTAGRRENINQLLTWGRSVQSEIDESDIPF
jgi:hypothetical protein